MIMMDANILSAMSRLRIALRTLESDLGMQDLTPTELDALAATVQLSEKKEHSMAAELAQHSLLDRISRASRYRAIHSLEDRGFLKMVTHKGRKAYTLSTGAQ